MPSFGTLVGAAFIVVAIVALAALLWTQRSGGHEAFTTLSAPSSTSSAPDLVDQAAPVPAKDAPLDQEASLDEYAARMYVLRVFNAVLRRRPTADELGRYAALKQETAIMKAIVKDMRIIQEEADDDDMCEPDSEDDERASVALTEEEEEDAASCDGDGDDDDDGASPSPQPSSRHLPVLADIDAPQTADKTPLPPPPVPPVPPPRRQQGAAAPPVEVCLSSKDVLARLKTIDGEVAALRDLLTMMEG